MPIPPSREARSCTAGNPAEAGAGAISLPVLSISKPKLKKSKAGPIRAGVLIAVHLAIAVHIGFWLASGRAATISPVEPSEAKDAFATGVINAGFIFFALAILSTLFLGRWFCGWGCHLVALQDLCGWAMKKMGVRPKPFRSRLLIWAPLVFGVYMFLWFGIVREAIVPAAKRLGCWTFLEPYLHPQPGTPFPAPVAHSGGQGLAFFRPELTKTEFWETFPREWYVIVPFLGICGFAVVYFLGAKGFCTYGCPYGGFFAPADKLSPFRIRVTDACEHCGHCTAVCTSNVRVHEEVRDYGMVVDPGCMKCLDCVSVCPNDALYFGFGKPAAFAKPRNPEAKKRFKRRVYDLTLGEELAIAGVFVGMILAFRGALEIPMLMAIGMAGSGAFLAWTLWRLIREPNVRLQSLQLKIKGRIRPAGIVFGALAAGTLLFAAWAGTARFAHWRAGIVDFRVSSKTDYETVFAPDYKPDPKLASRASYTLALFRLGNRPADGGIGWVRSPDRQVEIHRRMAWLSAVAGDRAATESHIRRAVQIAGQQPAAYANPALSLDDLLGTLLQLAMTAGKDAAAFQKDLESLAASAPNAPEPLLLLVQMHASAGREEEAVRSLAAAAEIQRTLALAHPRKAHLWVKYAGLLLLLNRAQEALDALMKAQALQPREPGIAAAIASTLDVMGRSQEALEWRNKAASLSEPKHAGPPGK